MATLIAQMHRKSLCKHDGYLPVQPANVDALAIEIAAYCRHPDPAALAKSLRQGHCQMFGIPLKVASASPRCMDAP